MNRSDVEILARLHQDQPRRCTLFTVALALERFRRQQNQAASPAELTDLTGVHYDNAKRAVREARRYLGGITQVSPPGDHSGIPGGSPGDPMGDHSGIPYGITQISPGGSLNDPLRKLEEEIQTHTPRAREGPPAGNGSDLDRAASVLASNLQTEALASVLRRSGHLERVQALAADGWRLESAARKFLDPGEVKESIRAARNTDNQIKYLLSIAADLAEPFEPRPIAEQNGVVPTRPRRQRPDVDEIVAAISKGDRR